MQRSDTMQNIALDYPETKNSLRRRMRLGETIIQAVLFLSGFVSIFITIGIVYELGKESMTFFTKRQWENTNKTLSAGIAQDTTEFLLGQEGSAVKEGDLFRLGVKGEEIMRVVSVDGNTIVVERGMEGTEPRPHDSGIALYTANRVTLFEFFTGTEWQPQIEKFGILPLVNASETIDAG